MKYITFKLQKDELETLIELLNSEIKSTMEFLSGDSMVLIDNAGYLDHIIKLGRLFLKLNDKMGASK